MIKQNDNLKYEVFVTDQVSLCRRLFTSPRFYVVFLVVQVAIIALVISMWDSDSYSTGQMVVITDKQMQEVLFNGTEQHFYFTGYLWDTTNTTDDAQISKCPIISPYLVGYRKPVINERIVWEEVLEKYKAVRCDSHFQPSNCKARQKVALIVPFRDRYAHLEVFLRHIHPFLMRQQLDYGIYVIDLDDKIKFNRGLLLNVGFIEASKEYDYDCYIFHDVDLLPENDKNLYRCSDQPRHMSVAVDKFAYKLPYAAIFGGVSAMTKDQILFVNGFSNKFSGWGGEDDDMFNRLKHHNMTVMRSMDDVSMYKMLKHKQSDPNPQRFKLIRTGMKRVKEDGVKNLQYKIMKKTEFPLYTYIKITF
nr:beta-1,4-galactosyltransferase 1-like isoform X1 [Crassostrea gigas]